MKKVVVIYRSFKRNSKITLINVLGMALGLVSAGIILGYVYQEFNYDQGQLNSDRIYRVIQKDGENQQIYTFGPLAESLKSNFPKIDDAVRISFFYGYLACSTNENKFNENSVIFTDPGFFEMFSFPLIKGDSKDCLNSPNSIVISEKAAEKYFGKKNPMGENIRIGKDRVFIVTGVYKDFKANSNFKGDLILPLKVVSKLTQIWIEPSWRHESDINTFVLVSDNNFISDLSEKARNLISKFITDSKIELVFQPLSNIHINKQLGWESTAQINVRYLYVLLVVAFLTLGISIVNFLFLYIGTAGQRRTEIGIKKVCGAPRTILFFEHFKEVMILMIFSIAIAILFYGVYQSVLTSGNSFLPRIELFDFKLAFILTGITVLVAFLAGVYPSIVLSSQKPISLFNRSINTNNKGKFMLVNLLIIIQFTLSIALMITTLMVHKQANYMAKRDPGFAKNEIITIPLNMHVGNGIYNEKFELFANDLKKYPGVKNVSLSSSAPSLVGSDVDDINWEGKQEGLKMYMNFESVSYNYFETIGVEVVEGRSFSRDFGTDELNWGSRTCAFLLNENAVKKMGITEPIGQKIDLWGLKGQVIGIVKDYNFKSMHSSIGPIFYINDPFYLNEIVVRINPKSMPATLKNIETVWNKFAGDYPLEIKNTNDQISDLYENDQNLAKILSVFSLLSILIAGIGLFTLTVLSISKRTKEIGIRKVNGAKVSEIITMLIKNHLKLVMIAFVFATPIAWFTIKKWFEVYAYQASISWWIFALTGFITLIIVLITVSWKSWEAATTNPVEALRYE